MKNKNQVISALSNAELCDDCLSVSSGVVPRQAVNIICRALTETSIINRHHGACDNCHKTKIINQTLERNTAKVESFVEVLSSEALIRPWYWEGNVQSQVVKYLALNNFTIRSVADTASRTSGKDIIAINPDDDELWISVKGYPDKSSNTQARHWFSGAIFDLVLYHGENSNAKLGIALPDGFITYTNLFPRIKWIKESMPFQIYWVSETGSVRVE